MIRRLLARLGGGRTPASSTEMRATALRETPRQHVDEIHDSRNARTAYRTRNQYELRRLQHDLDDLRQRSYIGNLIVPEDRR